MYPKQVSLCNVFLFVVLATFAVNNVSALECYKCTTEDDPRCYSMPSETMTCGAASLLSVNEKRGATIFNTLATSSASNPAPHYNARNSAYDCATFKVEYEGDIQVLRGCSEKNISCQDYAKNLEKRGMKLKECNRCFFNLCNDSC